MEKSKGIKSSFKEVTGAERSGITFLGLLAIILWGLSLYSGALHVPFIFDDYSSIVDNETIKNLKTALKDISNNRYIAEVSFALNYAVGGVKPVGYHFINNLLHVVNALLIYCFVTLTFRTPKLVGSGFSARFVAFSSAFIFIVHPAQTQTVTYIAQRAASMATMFYLIAIVLYTVARLAITRSQGERIHKSVFIFYLFSVIAAVLAMKTKEIAFTLPVVVILYEFCFFNRVPLRRRLIYLFPLIFTVLIIPLGMINIGGSIETITRNMDIVSRETVNMSRGDYLSTQLRVVVTYLRLLFLPVNQNLDYRYPVYHSFLNLHVFLSFLCLLLILSVAVYLFYISRAAHRLLRMTAFGIFWFFITLSVESSVIPIKDVIVEHRLYLPSIGFFTALLSAVEYALPRTMTKIVFVAVVVMLLTAGTYSRNVVWREEQTLWEDVVSKSPNNVRARTELAAVFRDQGKYDKALEQLEAALKINKNYALLYYNLGDIQYKLKNYKNALIFFHEALRLKLPPLLHMEAFNSLGMTYSEMGDDEKAVEAFKEAIQVLPASVISYNNLGLQYIKMGKYDLAVEIFEKGLAIRDEPHLRYNLSVAYAKKAGGKGLSEKND